MEKRTYWIQQLKSILVKVRKIFTKIMILEFLIVLFKFLGWVSLIFMIVDDQPKIQGTILEVITGTTSEKGDFTVFTIYPYISNISKNDIEFVKFDLELDYGDGFKKLGLHLMQKDIPPVRFSSTNGENIEINDMSGQQIYNKLMIVEYGQPLHGFMSFKGDISLYNKTIERFKLICYDARGTKHILYSDDSRMNHALMVELAKLKIY